MLPICTWHVGWGPTGDFRPALASIRVARAVGHSTGGTPLLVGRDVFAYHVEQVVAARLAQELELLTQVFYGTLEAFVGPQVALEAPVAAAQLENAAGILDGGLDFAAVPDDPFVL